MEYGVYYRMYMDSMGLNQQTSVVVLLRLTFFYVLVKGSVYIRTYCHNGRSLHHCYVKYSGDTKLYH